MDAKNLQPTSTSNHPQPTQQDSEQQSVEMVDAGPPSAVDEESPFENIYNFRDVGETVNKHTSGRYAVFILRLETITNSLISCRIMREKMMYRSGRLGERSYQTSRNHAQGYF